MTGNKPLKKISAGPVSAALWENEIKVNGQAKTVLKASIQRRFKDRDGTWKSTTSFSRNEIPMAIHCLEKAFEAMLGEENGEVAENGTAEEEVVM